MWRFHYIRWLLVFALTSGQTPAQWRAGKPTNIDAQSTTGTAVRRAPTRGHPELLTGLVAYWALSGNFTDKLGAHNGIQNGSGTPPYAAGHVSPLAFISPAVNNIYITMTPFARAAPWTLSAWVYPITPSTHNALIGQSSGLNVCAKLTGGVLNPDVYVSADRLGSSVIPQNTWSHVVFVDNGTTLKFYVNGVLDATTRTGGVSFTALTYLVYDGFSGENWHGYIQDEALYSIAWTSTNVSAAYNGGAGLAYPFQ